jgi:two-component system, NarL family, nitrate/nitrite response regulator NarL
MTMRVLVVSDVRVVQEGVLSVLSQRDEVDVVSTADMQHARDDSARLRPDVVLFDATREESLEFARDLAASVPCTKVVAFGVKETEEGILALAAAGTAGYIRDSAASGDLVRVLERLMCDELPCSARAAASLYRRVARLSLRAAAESEGSAHSAAVPLSQRELQVAQLIDGGLSNKQIARRLGIEAATVKNHVHNICEKLKVHRRGQAAARIRALLRSRGGGRVLLRAPAPEINPALEA